MNDLQAMVTLMTLWRVWYVHNEITHEKPGTAIEASRRFLTRYIQTLLLCDQHPNTDTMKGKQVVDLGGNKQKRALDHAPELPWVPPEPGHTKLNVDGSFLVETGRLVLV